MDDGVKVLIVNEQPYMKNSQEIKSNDPTAKIKLQVVVSHRFGFTYFQVGLINRKSY